MRSYTEVSSSPPPGWGGLEPPRGGGTKPVRWYFEARNQRGEFKRGELVATDRDGAKQYLEQRGYSEITLRWRWPSWPDLRNALGLIGRRERVFVTRALATMLEAGLPPAVFLSVINEHMSNRRVMRELSAVERGLAEGVCLSSALRRAKRLFGDAAELDGAVDADVAPALLKLEQRIRK